MHTSCKKEQVKRITWQDIPYLDLAELGNMLGIVYCLTLFRILLGTSRKGELGYFWPKFAINIFFWLLGLFGYFWKYWEKLVLALFLCVWCKYFGFSKVLWCRSFGVFYNLASFCSNFLATLIRVVYNITYFLQLEEISQESYIDRVRLNHQT